MRDIWQPDRRVGTGKSHDRLITLSRRRLDSSLRRQERQGLDAIALAQGGLCLFVLTLHLIAQYSIGWAGFNPWVIASLTGLVATSAFRYAVIRIAEPPQTFFDLLNIVDVSLFLWLVWSYQYAYDMTQADILKAPSFAVLFVLVALRALQLHPRPLIVTGMAAVVGWSIMTIMVVAPGGTNITHNYLDYLAGGHVLFGAEIEKLVALGAAVVFLAVASGRAYAMLSMATHVDDYARAVRVAERNLKAAKAAATAKAEFLANMSHELRTPMNGVLGMTEVLAKTELTTRQRDYLNIIHSSGSSLLTIINDILDLSKIEAGKLQLDPHPFNLKRALEDITTLLSSHARDKHVEIIMRYRPGLPETFVGDGVRIRQIITNLAGNAIKFTERGHVLVDISGEAQSDGQVRLRIAVEDTGIGIPEDKLDMIFDKFEQVDMSAARHYAGTGLGLAITKRLVSMMDGEIGVSSQLGKGSLFWFVITLPASDDERATVPQTTDLPFLQGLRALVVDDIKVNRDIAMEHLQGWGLRPDGEGDPHAVIPRLLQAAAGTDPYRLVLLDYDMPDLDGHALAKQIRAQTELDDAAIIMLTSIGHSGDGQDYRKLGISDYLIKPVRAASLLATIARAVAGSKITARVEAVDDQKPPVAPVAPGEGETRGFVLVVEDNPANRILCQEMLSDMGYRAAMVARGDIALALFEREPPDLVLMDVSMPVMDGYETSAAMRAIERRGGLQRTPIVALTAHAMARDRDRCVAAGMDDYLSKPVRYDELLHVCRYWTAAARNARTKNPTGDPARARTAQAG